MQRTQQETRKLTIDEPEWWEKLYQTKKTPWDLGKPSPALMSYLKSPYAVQPGRIALPGCGHGHDCIPWVAKGFEVTGIDFAPSAVQSTFQKFQKAGVAGTKGYLLERDFFNIHEYDSYYDYIFEHCFFSAIDPSRRRTYVYTVADLLKPGGKLIGVWWLFDAKSGPPFGVSKDEIYSLFDKRFTIDMGYAPSDSVPQRRNSEFLTIMTKR